MITPVSLVGSKFGSEVHDSAASFSIEWMYIIWVLYEMFEVFDWLFYLKKADINIPLLSKYEHMFPGELIQIFLQEGLCCILSRSSDNSM